MNEIDVINTLESLKYRQIILDLDKHTFTNNVKILLQNKELNCLGYRWNIYTKYNFGNHKNSTLSFEDLDYFWETYYYISPFTKNESVNLLIIPSVNDINFTGTPEDINELREFLIQNWVKSCEYTG